MINTLLLDALQAALKGEQVAWNHSVSDAQWQALFHQANAHQVLPLVFQAIAGSSVAQHIPSQLFSEAKHSVIQQVTAQMQKTVILVNVYQRLQEQGIEPVVVKGAACRCLYPDPDLRVSGDEDLLIRPEEFSACHNTFLNFGLHVSDPSVDLQKDYEIPYRKKGTPLFIELHKHLFPPESRAYGNLNRFFAASHANTVPLTVNGVTMRTLSPDDHLFYLVCHAYKHFIHCGFGIRQLCDIALFIRHHSKELNWTKFYDRCRQIHAESFMEAILTIAQSRLGVQLDSTPWPNQWKYATIDESALLEDILNAGIFGYSSQGRVHSSNVTLDAVADAKEGSKPKYSLRTSLFPPRRYLQKQYRFLKKYPVLLPIAWGARIIAYGKKSLSSRNNAIEALSIGKDRVALLRQYNIIS